MTSTNPLIVVTGATGSQGGSVVRFLLKEKKYRLRGVTRKLDSPAAQELKAQGVEMVQADYYDVESIKKAFEGAYGVFSVTQFWETMKADDEIKQGKNMVDAAKAVGVKHFVWSTLEHCYVPHFDSKAVIDDYLKSVDLPRTSLYTAFYYENLKRVEKDADGTIVFNLPIVSDAKIFMFAVEDTGAFVAEAFRNPDKWIGKDMKVAAEFISIKEVVEVFNRTSGLKARYVEYDTPDEMKKYKGTDNPVNEELYLNFKYFYDNQSGVRDPEHVKSIYPEVQDWSRFLERHPYA